MTISRLNIFYIPKQYAESYLKVKTDLNLCLELGDNKVNNLLSDLEIKIRITDNTMNERGKITLRH